MSYKRKKAKRNVGQSVLHAGVGANFDGNGGNVTIQGEKPEKLEGNRGKPLLYRAEGDPGRGV